jgi:hypothetical protein
MVFELYQVGLAFVAALIGLFAWAGFTWRKRAKAQDHQLATPEFTEFKNVGSSGLYVATTFADRPLDRVSAHGLGFAGKANVHVSDSEVQVFRSGEQSFKIYSSALLDLSRTSGVIDKVVEKDGLLSLRWKLGEAELESHFRFANSQARDDIALKVSKLIVGTH